MQKLSCPVQTVNVGLTVGMSALLCAAGTSNMRSIMPNARFLVGKAGLEVSNLFKLEVVVFDPNRRGIFSWFYIQMLPLYLWQIVSKYSSWFSAVEILFWSTELSKMNTLSLGIFLSFQPHPSDF